MCHYLVIMVIKVTAFLFNIQNIIPPCSLNKWNSFPFSFFPLLFDMISGKMVEKTWVLKIEPSKKN